MLLFRVIRYGNDDEGPNGNDTNFLVHAKTVEEAATLVDERLMNFTHGKNIEPFCNQVIEIGSSICTNSECCIIMGPSYEPGFRYRGQKSWYRADIEKEWALEED